MRITQYYWGSLLRRQRINTENLDQRSQPNWPRNVIPSINPMGVSRVRHGLFVVVVLACFGLLPQARGACQQGCDLGHSNTFLGDDALANNTSGIFDTATGANALLSNTTGVNNTANGFLALRSNTAGGNNTASGANALTNNTTGSFNTANGAYALTSNTTGSFNAANGRNALTSNTTGDFNTANGLSALFYNTTGSDNTANGANALLSNTTGVNNTANGVSALLSNTTGDSNVANGIDALFKNTTGSNNTATGSNTLSANTTGFFNMANGSFALAHNTTGNYNVAEGVNALFANNTGSNNIAVGLAAGGNLTTGNNNIDIGNRGVAGESSRIRVGTKGMHTNTFIAGISGVAVAGGVGVIIDTNGHLGTVVSSARFKDEIKPMDKASEAILALEPVTFRYKHELDPNGIAQFGLVAEEVEKVSPDLVARDEEGKAYTVRYEAVNAMLLNEFIKEHRKVEAQGRKGREQETTIAKLESTVAQQQREIKALAATLKEQASQIQKVSARIEITKSAPQVVVNN